MTLMPREAETLEDTIATFNPLGFPERAIEDGKFTKAVLEKELLSK